MQAIGPVVLQTESLTLDTFDPVVTVSSGTPTWDLGDGSAHQISLAPTRVYTLAGTKDVLIDFGSLASILTINASTDDILTASLIALSNLTSFNLDANASMTSILANDLSLASTSFTGATLLETLDVSNNNLTTINLADGPALSFVDISDNPITKSATDQALIDLDTSVVVVLNGTFIYSTTPSLSVLINYDNLLADGWTLIGPVPMDANVDIEPPNPVEGESIQAIANLFIPSTSFSYDWQTNDISYAQLYLPCAGGAVLAVEDKSTNLRNATILGTTTFNATGGPTASIPSYWAFDGVGDGLEHVGYKGVPVTNGVGIICVSMWFRVNAFPPKSALMHMGFLSGNNDFKINILNTGFLAVDFSGINVVDNNAALSINTWYHVVALYTGGDANTTKIFLDGVDVSTPRTSIPSPNVGVTIGADLRWGILFNGNDPLDGDATDMRLYDQELSQTQITILAAGSIDRWVDNLVPKAPTIGLLREFKLNDNAADTVVVDSSPNAVNGTLEGGDNTADISDDGKVGTSLLFNGIDDYVDIGVIDLDDTFTISLWAYIAVADNFGIQTLVANTTTTNIADGFKLFVNNNSTSDGRVIFEAGNGTNGSNANTIAGAFTFDQWNHIAVRVTRSTTACNFFINGINMDEDNTTRNDFGNNQAINIGRMTNDLFYITGRLDMVRLYSRFLTEAEIRATYADEAPILISSLDDDAITTTVIDSSKRSDANDGIIVGGKTADLMTEIGRVKRAFNFTGASAELINFGSHPRYDNILLPTISCWIKTPGFVFDFPFIVGRNSGFNIKGQDNTGEIRLTGAMLTTTTLVGVTVITDDEWHHIACTYDGAALNIYVDGALDASIASTGTIIQDTNDFAIGGNPANTERSWAGSIDDVRLFDSPLSLVQIQELYNKTKASVFGYDAVSESMEIISDDVVIAEEFTGAAIAGSRYVRNSMGIRLVNSDGDYITT